ncbi:MAG: type II toxin-antitoxin system YafQ family toxin [Prevotella sp.]|jgi:mRNA interferase YafQ
MKKRLHPTSQYKKDFKRYLNQPKKLMALQKILVCLENGKPIPEENHPHQLHNDYADCWECHIQGDFLLIWINDEVIELVRLGSHSELFGNGRKK